MVCLFAFLDKQGTDQNAAAWAAYYAQYYNQPGQQSGGQPGQQPGQPQQPAAPQAASPQQGPGAQQPGQQSNFSTAPCGFQFLIVCDKHQWWAATFGDLFLAEKDYKPVTKLSLFILINEMNMAYFWGTWSYMNPNLGFDVPSFCPSVEIV